MQVAFMCFCVTLIIILLIGNMVVSFSPLLCKSEADPELSKLLCVQLFSCTYIMNICICIMQCSIHSGSCCPTLGDTAWPLSFVIMHLYQLSCMCYTVYAVKSLARNA